MYSINTSSTRWRWYVRQVMHQNATATYLNSDGNVRDGVWVTKLTSSNFVIKTALRWYENDDWYIHMSILDEGLTLDELWFAKYDSFLQFLHQHWLFSKIEMERTVYMHSNKELYPATQTYLDGRLVLVSDSAYCCTHISIFGMDKIEIRKYYAESWNSHFK